MTEENQEPIEEETTIEEVAEPVEPDQEVVEESETEETEAEDDQEETPDPEPEEKPNRIQRRIDKLTREKYEARAEAAAAKAKLEALEGVYGQGEPKEAEKPTRKQFENDDAYIDALTDWKIDKRMGASQPKAEPVNNGWNDKIAEAEKKYDDWDDVIEDSSDIKISKPVQEAIVLSDIGGDVLYYLAKNPKEAIRVSRMTPIAAAKAIGVIEANLGMTQQKPTKKTSNAPKPVKPVKPAAPQAKKVEDMTPSEYAAFRNKQDLEKGRRSF